MSDILNILRASPNVKIEITSRDFVNFVDEIVNRVKNEIVNIPHDEGFYTVEDVMNIYNIKARSTLYKWDKKGYLPCEKKGANVIYRKKVVHQILGNPK